MTRGPCGPPGSAPRSPALLDRLDDFRSAQEIHEELRRVGDGIGLTTVYRTLQALADGGEVDVLRSDSRRGRLPAVRDAPTTTTTWCAGGAARPSRSRACGRDVGAGRRGRARLLRPLATPSRSSGCAASAAVRSSQIDTAPGRRDD